MTAAGHRSYTVQIEPLFGSSMKYEVTVWVNDGHGDFGRRVSGNFTFTLWGARLAARKIIRRHRRRTRRDLSTITYRSGGER